MPNYTKSGGGRIVQALTLYKEEIKVKASHVMIDI